MLRTCGALQSRYPCLLISHPRPSISILRHATPLYLTIDYRALLSVLDVLPAFCVSALICHLSISPVLHFDLLSLGVKIDSPYSPFHLFAAFHPKLRHCSVVTTHARRDTISARQTTILCFPFSQSVSQPAIHLSILLLWLLCNNPC